MNMGTLKCSQAGDVYLLLKSSDFVSHDLYYPFDMCSQNETTDNNSITFPEVSYKLILRKWQNLRPERSFRCFIKNRYIVAISQRDCTAFFPQLSVEMEKITQSISNFFNSEGRRSKKENRSNQEDERSSGNNNLLQRFPDPNFVVDVYVDQSLKVWMVDINAWASSTDSLMFAWDDPPLQSNPNASPPIAVMTTTQASEEFFSPLSPTSPLVRIVDSESCLRPGAFSNYKAPLEMHQFSQSIGAGGGGSGGGDLAQQQGSAEGLAEFIAFMAQCEKQNNI